MRPPPPLDARTALALLFAALALHAILLIAHAVVVNRAACAVVGATPAPEPSAPVEYEQAIEHRFERGL